MAEFPKGWDRSLPLNVRVHFGIHVSLREWELPSAGSIHAALNHDATYIILD